MNTETIIQKLEESHAELGKILSDAISQGSQDLGINYFKRWKERVSKIIEVHISKGEADRFREDASGVISYNLDDDFGYLKQELLSHSNYLTALLAEIRRNPEFVISGDDLMDRQSQSPLARLEKICHRFHKIAKQLRVRHMGRETIKIEDEYDVQDLFHALLKLEFDDVRSEEWTPSYAGKSARTDFLLKAEKVIVEIKKTRESLTDKELGDELIIDIGRYQVHPDCKLLVCFVYDPEGKIGNSAGIINDLESMHTGKIDLKVIIEPN